MERIILQSDSWYIILCLVIGLVYATVLYYRQNQFKDKSKYLIIFLFILRFFSISLISFLLLSPLYKSVKEQKIKPVLIIGLDYSSSIANNYSKNQLAKIIREIKGLKAKLDSKYKVEEYSIGSKIQPGLKDSFDFTSTNLSSFFKYINETYDPNEIAGIVLSSDGIFNEGNNPIYTKLKFNAPIYSVALGDTSIRKDLFINNIFYNDYIFLGDKTSIKIDIQAKNLNGQSTKLKIWDISNKKKLVSEKQIKINKNDFYLSNIFEINPQNEGINHYRIEASPVKEEISTQNNYKDIYIEVVDSKLKIAILTNNPHPDISAIKDILNEKKNYQIIVEYDPQNINPKKYDLLIYFNLPSIKKDITSIHNTAKQYKIPELFIIGTKTNINEFNKLQNILKIKGNSKSTNIVQGVLNNDFDLFLTDNLRNYKIENFPPLVVPFGDYVISADARVLLYQKIKNIKTKYPLIILSADSNDKTGIIAGSNIFKWRLFEPLHNNNKVLESILEKLVQYLTIKKDKSQWRVKTSKKLYFDTQPVSFYAELYNDSYEPINSNEAYLKIIDEKGQVFDYVFSKEDTHYKIFIDMFPVGNYNFIAEVKNGNKTFTKKGKFKIIKKELEKFDLVARHDILNILSSKTEGEVFFPNEFDRLINELNKNNKKPIIYYSEKTNMLLDFKWLFAIILFLLSLEWFIRRYNGSF